MATSDAATSLAGPRVSTPLRKTPTAKQIARALGVSTNGDVPSATS